MANNEVSKPFSKNYRPFGVWIITIYEFIFTGMFHLLGTSGMMLRGEFAMFRSDAIPHMLLFAYLIIGIVVASVLAWGGWEPGRIFFLVLTSAYYIFVGESMFSWIMHPEFWDGPSWMIWDRITDVFQFIRFVLIPMLYIWYFNKPSTREFYKMRQSLN